MLTGLGLVSHWSRGTLTSTKSIHLLRDGVTTFVSVVQSILIVFAL